MTHKHLLNVLLDLGFRCPVLELTSSYLSNRIQRVKKGNQLSSWKTIEIGVPQGSVLGALLFIFYINKITYFSTMIMALICLPMTQFFCRTKWTKYQNIHYQKLVNGVVGLLNNKSMTINCEKTVEFIFSRSNRSNQATIPTIKIYGDIIDWKPCVKYFGVFIDNHLNFNE